MKQMWGDDRPKLWSPDQGTTAYRRSDLLVVRRLGQGAFGAVNLVQRLGSPGPKTGGSLRFSMIFHGFCVIFHGFSMVFSGFFVDFWPILTVSHRFSPVFHILS